MRAPACSPDGASSSLDGVDEVQPPMWHERHAGTEEDLQEEQRKEIHVQESARLVSYDTVRM